MHPLLLATLLTSSAARAEEPGCEAEPVPPSEGAMGVLVLRTPAEAPEEEVEAPTPLVEQLRRGVSAEIKGEYGERYGLEEGILHLQGLDCAPEDAAAARALARRWESDWVIFGGASPQLVQVDPPAPLPALLPLARMERSHGDPARFTLLPEEDPELGVWLLLGLERARDPEQLAAAQGYLEESYDLLFDQAPRDAAAALVQLSLAQLRAGRAEAALLTSQDAVSGCEGDSACRAYALEQAGRVALALGEAGTAVERFAEARQEAGAATPVTVRFGLALAQLEAGDSEAALAELDPLLLAFETTDDDAGQALVLLALAELRHRQGETGGAMGMFERVLALTGEAPGLRSLALDGLGRALVAEGQVEEALPMHAEAIERAREAGEDATLLAALEGQAQALLAAERPEDAVRPLQEASLLAATSGRDALVGPMSVELGRALSASGEHTAAEAAFAKASSRCEAAGQVDCQIDALVSLGRSLLDRGEQAGRAVPHLRQALEVAEAHEDTERQAELLLTLAGIYEDAGDLKGALEQFQSALPLIEASGDEPALARLLNRIAMAHAALGQNEEAVATWERGFPLMMKHVEVMELLDRWFLILDIRGDMGRPEEALSQAELLIPRMVEVEDARVRVNFLLRVAELRALSGQYAQAASLYAQLTPELEVLGDPERHLKALLDLAELQADLGLEPAARVTLEQADALTAEDVAGRERVDLLRGDLALPREGGE